MKCMHVSISSVMGTNEASKMAAMVLPSESMLTGHFLWSSQMRNAFAIKSREQEVLFAFKINT